MLNYINKYYMIVWRFIIIKVVKLPLIIDQFDKEDKTVDFKIVNKILWDLQNQTREIKNKTIQLCWEYNNFSSDYYKKNNHYPNTQNTLGKYRTLPGFINNQFSTGNSLYSENCSTTIRSACKDFNNSKSDIRKGTKSILNYKSNQPLDLHNKSITLSCTKNGTEITYYLSLCLLNKNAVPENNFKDSKIHFKLNNLDKSSRTILERCYDKIYSISASKLIYNQKKKHWEINLAYSFTEKVNSTLEKDKILGVDLGVQLPICASIYGDKNRFTILGGEIEEFRKRVEARKKSLQKQGRYCGDGRIGHGVKTRNKPVFDIEDKIARFRDTANHKYSRELINFAIKNNCSTIQMEDLSGITYNSNRFLKNWSYYDLQNKIKYKAKETGIDVILISPKYTSQRCSKCGNIDSENRTTQAKFKCNKCGFEENADYNASQNISIKDIDKIINTTISQKSNSANTK